MTQQHITLTPEQADAFGRELDAIRDRVIEDLGQADVDYIRRVIKAQRSMEVTGRALLFAGIFPPAWLAGTALLAVSKILDNMEIGHNVMHGQYEWTGDPAPVRPDLRVGHRMPRRPVAALAQLLPPHLHQYRRHGPRHRLRHPADEPRPTLAAVLPGQPASTRSCSWCCSSTGWHCTNWRPNGSAPVRSHWPTSAKCSQEIWRKTRRQVAKDYVAFPLLAGPFAPFVFAGNMTANLIRNVWSYAIIFCGHFPDGTQEFSVEETRDESRGQWYFRQVLGSANLTGGRLFHILSGNLSFQIEHHLFPDLPARRYAEIAPQVQEVCGRYGIPYNAGPLPKQFATVVRKIARLALPDRIRSARPVQAALAA